MNFISWKKKFAPFKDQEKHSEFNTLHTLNTQGLIQYSGFKDQGERNTSSCLITIT